MNYFIYICIGGSVVERLAVNQRVGGSNPSRCAKDWFNTIYVKLLSVKY
jgi:hypothetical protein